MSGAENPPRFVLTPANLISMVEEGGLSKEAAWLYVVLLSHHNRKRRNDDVWPSRAKLAQKCGLKKPDSVDKYLAELRKAGLITSEERRRSGNMKTSSKHTLKLIVPRTAAEEEAIRQASADTPYTGYRYPRQRGTDTPATGQELYEGELDELKEVEEKCLTSGRSAPFGAGHNENQDRRDELDDPWEPAGDRSHERPVYENWHEADRETFREHVGDILISDGSRWGEGRFTADAFYNAFRMRQKNRTRWPGQYINRIAEDNHGRGVDDWLIDQGLRRPEWD